eukprot:gene3755-7454_t
MISFKYLRKFHSEKNVSRALDLTMVHAFLMKPCTDLLTETKGSLLPGAGMGIFLNRPIPPRTIVTLYPGIYYPPCPVWTVASPSGDPVIRLTPTIRNEYTINCDNIGGFIDGSKGSSSPYAVAHLINHPPKGCLPNVVSIDFSWTDFFRHCSSLHGAHDSEALIAIKQHVSAINSMGEGDWYVDPHTDEVVRLSPDCAPLAGMAFLSTKNIDAGQELLYDYRYGPGNAPEWYSPVDYHRTHDD